MKILTIIESDKKDNEEENSDDIKKENEEENSGKIIDSDKIIGSDKKENQYQKSDTIIESDKKDYDNEKSDSIIESDKNGNQDEKSDNIIESNKKDNQDEKSDNIIGSDKNENQDEKSDTIIGSDKKENEDEKSDTIIESDKKNYDNEKSDNIIESDKNDYDNEKSDTIIESDKNGNQDEKSDTIIESDKKDNQDEKSDKIIKSDKNGNQDENSSQIIESDKKNFQDEKTDIIYESDKNDNQDDNSNQIIKSDEKDNQDIKSNIILESDTNNSRDKISEQIIESDKKDNQDMKSNTIIESDKKDNQDMKSNTIIVSDKQDNQDDKTDKMKESDKKGNKDENSDDLLESDKKDSQNEKTYQLIESDKNDNKDENSFQIIESDMKDNQDIKTDKKQNDKDNKPSDTNESCPCSCINKDMPTEKVNETNKENNPLDVAKNRANIRNSFRQLSEFRNERKIISFTLFGLVTKTFKEKTQISVLANLIKITGEIELSPKNITCILESTVEVIEGNSTQAEFKCVLTGLEEEYYSLRFYKSEFISGIPINEILLNPELTHDAIILQEVYDYSRSKSKIGYKIPTFTVFDIKENNSYGELIIEGILNEAVSNKLKFNLRLTYPEGVSMLCSFTSFEAGHSSIICKVDRDIHSEPVIIEQTIIRYENDEIFVITGITSKNNITCENGLLKEAKEKINKGIAFRKVKNFELNGNDEFSFIMEAILSELLKKDYNFTLSIIALIGNYKKEKDSYCMLQNTTKNKFIIGYFKCVTKVSHEEYININFNRAESITISPYNTNITGVSNFDKNRLKPLLKIISDNNTDSEPISFQPKKLAKMEECRDKGKFRIIGTFDGKFEEKIFEFSLSYPSVNVKCRVEEAEVNKEVEIICKIQREFIEVKSLVIESRIITKRNKEILFIKNIDKTIFENISMSCENYNKIKFNKAIRNQRANFTFLTISKFNPSDNSNLFTNFYIGMERRPNKSFAEIKIPINAKYSIDSQKQLDKSEISKSTNCSIAIQKGTIVFYECISETQLPAEPSKISIDYDNIENIAGLPEYVGPSKLNFKLDYSNRNNLDKINEIPIVNITNINYLYCNNGSFIITGKILKGKLNKRNDVEIQFSFPDSVSNCKIKPEFSNIIMECQNEEKFPISPIMFDQTYVKDTDGNILFKLNNYIHQQQFACEVGIFDSSKKSNKKWKLFIYIFPPIVCILIVIIIILLCKYWKKPSPFDPFIPKIPKIKDIDNYNNLSENYNSTFKIKLS